MTTDTALPREDQVRLGLWMFLATVTMLFAAFASAYVVRRSGSDWRPVALPSILWWNTLVLGASSAAVEIAGRRRAAAPSAMLAALALGFVFLAGQLEAWRELRAAGVYLPTSPHSSFFFMLTGAHAAHVAAALVVLAWGAAGAAFTRDARGWSSRMTVCRTFWHYLGGVWIFLFALMSVY
jgi:cytochrome c oxidase subunit 3